MSQDSQVKVYRDDSEVTREKGHKVMSEVSEVIKTICH